LFLDTNLKAEVFVLDVLTLGLNPTRDVALPSCVLS